MRPRQTWVASFTAGLIVIAASAGYAADLPSPSEEAGYQQTLAEIAAKSGSESLDLALAEADLAIALVERMSRLDEEKRWSAYADQLLTHAGPILVRHLAPNDGRRKAAAAAFYRLHLFDKSLDKLGIGVGYQLKSELPRHRLPTAEKAARVETIDKAFSDLPDEQRQQAFAEKLAIFSNTFGVDHPATANLILKGMLDGGFARESGDPSFLEPALRAFAAGTLEVRKTGLAALRFYLDLKVIGLRDDDAQKAMRCYVEPGSSPSDIAELYRKLTQMAGIPAKPIVEQGLANYARGALTAADCAKVFAGGLPSSATTPSSSLALDRIEAVAERDADGSLRKLSAVEQGWLEQRARAGAQAPESLAWALRIAEMTAGDLSVTRSGETDRLFAAIYPDLVAAFGPRDRRVLRYVTNYLRSLGPRYAATAVVDLSSYAPLRRIPTAQEATAMRAQVNIVEGDGKSSEKRQAIAALLALQADTVGEAHPGYAETLALQGDELFDAGQDGEPAYQRALGIMSATLGPDDDLSIGLTERFIDHQRELARREMSAGEASGRERLRRAIARLQEMAQQADAKDEPFVAAAYDLVLAEDEEALENYPAAEGSLRRVLTRANEEKDGKLKAQGTEALISFYERRGRFADAAPYLREIADGRILADGPESEAAAAARLRLAKNLRQQGKIDEAKAIAGDALAVRTRLLGPSHPKAREVADFLASVESGALADLSGATAAAVATPSEPNGVASLALIEGFDELGTHAPAVDAAEIALRDARQGYDWNRALAASGQKLSKLKAIDLGAGRRPGQLFEALREHAQILTILGEIPEAEATWRQRLEMAERQNGVSSGLAAVALLDLGRNLELQRRLLEAESVVRRANAIVEPLTRTSISSTLYDFPTVLADTLEAQGRLDAAEALRRDIYQRTSPSHKARAGVLLARNLARQGRADEASGILDEAVPEYAPFLRDIAEDDAGIGQVMADLLIDLGRPLVAKRMADEQVQGWKQTLGLDAVPTARASLAGARAAFQLNDPQGALARLRAACPVLTQPALDTGAAGALRRARREGAACAELLTRSLLGTPAPEALAEAFEASQRAQLSDAAGALSESSARAAAASAGAGAALERYERAASAMRLLAADDADAFGARTADAARARAEALKRREATNAEFQGASDDLRRRFPAFWDLRSPQPLSIKALQAQGGATELLRPTEALISFVLPEGETRGIIFAVSPQKSAWAEITLTTAEIERIVARLRREIDPLAYGVVGDGRYVEYFDRRKAFELHQALLGSAAVQDVMAQADTLIVVPTGVLTSLPPALLVTRAPAGRDDQADAQRATAWLIREKAIAVLPSVAALRTLRGPDRPRALHSSALQSFADPDFNGPELPDGPSPPPNAPNADAKPESAPRGLNRAALFYRDGRPDPGALLTLPRLPGTLREASALQRTLGAPDASVHVGMEASEAVVNRLNDNGGLGAARVVSFATHGLVAGDLDNLAEPALALARPQADHLEDGLLTAGEAAQLKLSAEWVLLSACNTASPDGGDSDGISGLARSFFYAGARSLLASHWRVSDLTTATLIERTFMAEKNQASKAASLQQAMLSILDDPEIEGGTDPASWAPFVLYGAPD